MGVRPGYIMKVCMYAGPVVGVRPRVYKQGIIGPTSGCETRYVCMYVCMYVCRA